MRSRKLLLFTLAVITAFVFILIGCGSQKSSDVVQIVDSAYTITPQAYIDAINAVVDEQNDSRYWKLSEYKGSGKSTKVNGSSHLSVKLTENESGNLSEIYWDWDAGYAGISDNLSLYFSATIYMLSNNNDRAISNVLDELDMQDTVPPKYSTSCTQNGTLYYYDTYGHGKYNSLTISPEDK